MKNKLKGSRLIAIGVFAVIFSVALPCFADWFSYCRDYPGEVISNDSGPGSNTCSSQTVSGCDGSVCGIIVDEHACSGALVPSSCDPNSCDSVSLTGDAHCGAVWGGYCNCQ